jgi:hypothetical protein
MVFVWDDILLAGLGVAGKAAIQAGATSAVQSGKTAKTRKQFNKDLMWERQDKQRKIGENARDIIGQASLTTLGGGVREGTHAKAINDYSAGLQRQVYQDTESRKKPKPGGIAGFFESIFKGFYGD